MFAVLEDKVMEKMLIDVVIPTYKPGQKFLDMIDMLQKQSIKPNKIIIMNTEEKYFNKIVYGSNFLKKNPNVEVFHISKREFNHGKTRNEGARRSKASILVFMTDDAVPVDEHLIEELVKPMLEKRIAVTYARQMAEKDSSEIEKFTRTYNYPERDREQKKEDLGETGIKTYFCSNVCAAYKRYVFEKLGGFIKYTIFNEDMIFASKVLGAGRSVYYASSARVYHTHEYSYFQHLRRNFDLAVSQADHPEIFSNVSSEKEGSKYAKAAKEYFKQKKKSFLYFPFIIQCAFRYLGYRLGLRYEKLPRWLILKLTMNKDYWIRYWDKTDIPDNVYGGYGKGENETK